ncbi:MAG: hypothetical protein ACTSO9_18725 [Candidatus Helarchaeota archaeon]
MISSNKFTPENEEMIGLFKDLGVFERKFNKISVIKELKQIVLDCLDHQIILSILQSDNFILTIAEQKQDLALILNELKNLVKKVDEFFYSKNVLEKYHLLNLDENIKKLEKYLEIMQPPTFKDIKKLIEYIS